MNTMKTIAMIGVLPAAIMSSAARADVYVSQVPPDGSAPSILVFASDARGDTAPIRVISGPNTLMVAPFAITVDPVNNELYVSDFFGEAVRVYPLDADGDVAPLRNLTNGPNSHLVWPRQLVVDTVNDEIIVPSFNIFDPPPAPASSIRVYPRTADGDIAPLRSIFGDNTMLDNPLSLTLDSTHDELLTNSYSAGGPGAPGVLAFSRVDTGDAIPLRTLSGPATTILNYTNWLAHDPVNDEIYVDAVFSNEFFANLGYAVFPRTASGDVAPARTVSGVEAGLSEIAGIVYDPVNDRVIVSNCDDDGGDICSLNVFAGSASGNVPPELSIAGPSTQLGAPGGIAIDGTGGFSEIGAQVYKVADDFDAAIADPGSLALEDFEGGATEAGDVVICDEPVGELSNDDCFSPGQLMSGFGVSSSSGAGVAAVGGGFFGNPSTAVGAVFIGDSTIVELDRASTTVAMDVFLYNGSDADSITIAIYGTDGRSLGYSSVRPLAESTQTFVGVIAPAAIGRIELKATNGGAFIDNLRFDSGDGIFSDDFDG
jgi:hypothetical protein